MANFQRAANPIWAFFDLSGNILNDEYYISFLSKTFPYLPQLVSRDNQGLTAWPNPLQFLPNGTLPNNLFFQADATYRLEIRHGQTQNDQLIYVINDFVPGTGGGTNVDDVSMQSNQASNSQFAFINFTSPVTFTTAGVHNIAPDWDLVLTGAGSATVTQLVFTGMQNVLQVPPATNPNSFPPYALRITTSGWTSAILRQRYQGVGAIWYNNFVSASIFARSESGPNNITVNYHANGLPAVPIISSIPLATGTIFQTIAAIVALNSSANNTLNNAAFVDIEIVLPNLGTTDISNIQIMGQKNIISPADLTALPDETLERQIDHLFHYYNPKLQYKPIPSHLVGWDFPLNPSQFGTTIAASGIGANKSFYAWDQTIVFQSANSGVSVGRGANGDIELTAAATTQMALIQYAEEFKARTILSAPLSVHIAATGTPTLCTVSLYYTNTAALPNVALGTNNSLVLSLDANGKPASFNGAWAEVPRLNGQNATFTTSAAVNNNFVEFSLNGWDLQNVATAGAANNFAIVIGTAPVAAGGQLNFQSIGLYSGDIATRPAPQSADEVLRQCQYYFEKSYDVNVWPPPGVTTLTGIIRRPQTQNISAPGNASEGYRLAFTLDYMTIKRKVPTITFFSENGVINNVTFDLIRNNSSLGFVNLAIAQWNPTAIKSTARMIGSPTNTSPSVLVAPGAGVVGDYAEILFHYLCDSRLGIVL